MLRSRRRRSSERGPSLAQRRERALLSVQESLELLLGVRLERAKLLDRRFELALTLLARSLGLLGSPARLGLDRTGLGARFVQHSAPSLAGLGDHLVGPGARRRDGFLRVMLRGDEGLLEHLLALARLGQLALELTHPLAQGLVRTLALVERVRHPVEKVVDLLAVVAAPFVVELLVVDLSWDQFHLNLPPSGQYRRSSR